MSVSDGDRDALGNLAFSPADTADFLVATVQVAKSVGPHAANVLAGLLATAIWTGGIWGAKKILKKNPDTELIPRESVLIVEVRLPAGTVLYLQEDEPMTVEELTTHIRDGQS